MILLSSNNLGSSIFFRYTSNEDEPRCFHITYLYDGLHIAPINDLSIITTKPRKDEITKFGDILCGLLLWLPGIPRFLIKEGSLKFPQHL